ncbi:MAG: hypothetical protein LBR26_01775, partial [Prevotella sp.]|nr:hypothetical protein [Prevotella sp.]
RQGGFDLAPGQATCQSGQGVAQVNHLIESGSEKVVGGHRNFPRFSQFSRGIILISRGFLGGFFGENPLPVGVGAFCRADYVKIKESLAYIYKD